MAIRRRPFLLLLLIPVALLVLAVFSNPRQSTEDHSAVDDVITFHARDREVRVMGSDRGMPKGLDVQFMVRVPWLLDPVPFDPYTDADGEVVAVVTAADAAGGVVPVDHEGADVWVSDGVAVEGVVLDLYGEPIAGARVVHPERAPFLGETRADEEGRFRFERVAPDATLRAEADGFAPLDLSLTLYPEKDPDLAFYLVRGKKVSGQVVDSEGRGVPRAVVALDQESSTRILADEDGRFTLDTVLSDWEVLLTAHAIGLVGPVVHTLVGETDVEIPLYRPAEIHGEVILGGTGEPVDEFDLRRIDGEVLAGGKFVAKGLLPGEHGIEVRAGSRRAEAVVEVREGESRRDVLLTVQPPRWTPPREHRLAHPVELLVTSATDGNPAEGALIRGERRGEETRTDRHGRVAVRLLPGEHLLRVGSAIGKFKEVEVLVKSPCPEPVKVEVIPNDKVQIRFLGGKPEARSKLWLRAGDEVREHKFRGNPFDFTADRETPIGVYVKARGFLPAALTDVLVPNSGRLEVELPSGAFIRGRCLGSGGHPLAKVVAEVQERPLDARMETIGDGVFKAGALEPGNYRFLLYARNVRTRTIDLDVTEEGVDLGDVQMLPPCDLHIQVVTSIGAPVPHALVETSILVAAKGATDATGRVVLPGTNPEEMLQITAPGFVDTWHEVRVPEGLRDMAVIATVYRPARLILRTVDLEDRPVEISDSEGADLHRVGPGTYEVKNLPPGPLEITLTGREGREGVLQTVLFEGQERMETVILK